MTDERLEEIREYTADAHHISKAMTAPDEQYTPLSYIVYLDELLAEVGRLRKMIDRHSPLKEVNDD
uniref:Uncharacterized protein n=1 Tax=viral metagenome TaxID=1070528 RepID=A0A6M3LD88_9ZZZZ